MRMRRQQLCVPKETIGNQYPESLLAIRSSASSPCPCTAARARRSWRSESCAWTRRAARPGRGSVSELAFARNARIEPHSNPNMTYFIVVGFSLLSPFFVTAASRMAPATCSQSRSPHRTLPLDLTDMETLFSLQRRGLEIVDSQPIMLAARAHKTPDEIARQADEVRARVLEPRRSALGPVAHDRRCRERQHVRLLHPADRDDDRARGGVLLPILGRPLVAARRHRRMAGLSPDIALPAKGSVT